MVRKETKWRYTLQRVTGEPTQPSGKDMPGWGCIQAQTVTVHVVLHLKTSQRDRVSRRGETLTCEPPAARPDVGSPLGERQHQAAGGSPAGLGGLAATPWRSSAVAVGSCRQAEQRGGGSPGPGEAASPPGGAQPEPAAPSRGTRTPSPRLQGRAGSAGKESLHQCFFFLR